MSTSVLVTGAAGKLGRRIVQLLQEQGHRVVGVDLLAAPEVSTVLDIKDQAAVFEVMSRVSQVIHTAALHGRHMDLNLSRQQFLETNVTGTLNLLEAASELGINKFVFTSSTSIYGKAMVDSQQAVWVDESLNPIPRDIYDITKQAGEALCQDFFEKERLQTCVLRVSRFMKEPLNNIANYRLYRGLDVTDGAQAHLLALDKVFEKFEIFNISNCSPFMPKDLLLLKTQPHQVIANYYPEADTIYQQQNWSFPESIDRVYVIEKAQRLLHFKPKNNFLDFILNPSSEYL